MNSEKILKALAEYKGDYETLLIVAETARQELGEDWMQHIYEDLSPLDTGLKERLDHAFNYYAATMSWNEIQDYLGQEFLNTAAVRERVPVLQHWLAFFGDAGMQAVEQLQQKLDSMPTAQDSIPTVENVMTEASATVETAEMIQQPVDETETVQYEENKQSLMGEESSQVAVEEIQEAAPSAEDKNEEESVELKEVSSTVAEIQEPLQQPIEQPAMSDTAPEAQATAPVVPVAPEVVVEEPQTNSVLDTSVAATNEQTAAQPVLAVSENESVDWLIQKTFRDLEFIEQVQSWIDARCISLGNIDRLSYKYYGFLIDVFRQTVKDIEKLLADTTAYPLIEQKQAGGLKSLQDMQIVLKKHLEMTTEEAPLTKEELTKEELKRTLGGIDTSNTKEYLGPAPDGFEMQEDPYKTAQAQEEYEQLEEEDKKTGLEIEETS